MPAFSPMMQKYLETKEQYKDCVLFYRLGDFYEMFFDDAVMVSRELELTLTGKDCGQEERAPMCGIPFHAADTYINKLVANGHKVAICEQVEDPKLAKGLVKREVIRVVTPGTNFNPSALEEGKNNYIMCVVYLGNVIGISVSDITTGEYLVTEIHTERELFDEINKFTPSELICNEPFLLSGISIDDIKARLNISVSSLQPYYFDDELSKRILLEHFKVADIDGLGLRDYQTGCIAAGALLQYLYETQKSSLPHLTHITPYAVGKYMIVDSSTRRNLELTETLREKQKRGSLLWVLDKTKTAMGARKLRQMLEQPLVVQEDIIRRQEAVSFLKDDVITREELREYLNPVYDLERLIGRISTKSASPRDLIALKSSLSMLPHIKYLIRECKIELLAGIHENIDELADVCSLIESSIVDEPPITIKDGGLIKEGFNEEIDRLRKAKTEGKNWLADLETQERERTGIKNLRIKFNKVFGYYIEILNSFRGEVPDDYIRKQTLTNAERYSTPKLKELEDIILNAEDKLFSLEYDVFADVREQIAAQVIRIQQTASAIASLDVLASLAAVAEQNNYVRPKINTKGVIDIKDGRHPVVEKMIPNNMFIPNDTYLDNNKKRVSIITGPNMAGKSTYMRQTALIVLMAQIGSFVPAKSADIGLVDRIFTRVGASDDLASGQSTFMVEMNEVANILRNATSNSLLVLDEIGRGTSTFDGLSIAWSVVEHISNPKLLGAKTLFATHYHELTELEGTIDSVNNYCIAVKEQGDDIVFLRKIVTGGADKSYGIQVAKLAGVPDSVINRAKEILADLVDADISAKAKEIAMLGAANAKSSKRKSYKPDDVDLEQMTLFDAASDNDIIDELKNLDIGNLTPIEALNTLYRLQNKIKNRWSM